jgi:tetratricopeptide (TPR) repeat protein
LVKEARQSEPQVFTIGKPSTKAPSELKGHPYPADFEGGTGSSRLGDIVSLLKSLMWSAVRAPTVQSWTIDRNWNRAEGERLLKAHQYPEAEPYLEEAVAEADQHSTSQAKRVRLRAQLADVQRRQGKFAEAEANLRQAIHLAAGSSDSAGYLLCLDSLAEVFFGQGNYAASEKVSQEGVRIESALPHPDPTRMARRVHRLGISRYKGGSSDDAIPALKKGLELHEQAYGTEHAETNRVLSELGAIYRAEGLHEDAQACLRRSLRYHQRAFGAEDSRAIHDLHQLAGSLEESGDTEAAAHEYERVMDLKNRMLGRDLDEVGEMQFSLASLYVGWGNYPRARELLLECLGAFKRKAGPRLAVAHELLAQVEELSGRFHDAVRELDRAGKVWENHPERTAELAANLEYRAELLDQLRRKREAAWLRERAAGLTHAAGA